MKPRGLFLNVRKAECSIYESGVMIYNNIRNSPNYSLDYTETTNKDMVIGNYDFYVFNYHFRDMGWLAVDRLNLPGLTIAFVLEMTEDDPFVMTPKEFDVYCVMDPTIYESDNLYAFPRALDNYDVPAYQEKKIPQIGTFGFLTRGKGYDKVVEAVGKEFTEATVRINIPFGTHIGFTQRIKMRYLEWRIRRVTRRGIDVHITHDYLSKWELLKWCSENTLNVFLYDRDLPGLAATCDQCITSGRPLAVSDNPTFRHILEYVLPYPKWSLMESIKYSEACVKVMKNEWSKEKFKEKFEYVVSEHISPYNTISGCNKLPSISKMVYVYNRIRLAVYWRYRWLKHLLKSSRNLV